MTILICLLLGSNLLLCFNFIILLNNIECFMIENGFQGLLFCYNSKSLNNMFTIIINTIGLQLKLSPKNCNTNLLTPQFHGSVLQPDLLTFFAHIFATGNEFQKYFSARRNSFDLTQNSVKAVLTVSNLIMMRTYVFR